MQLFDQYRLYIGIACAIALLIWKFSPSIKARLSAMRGTSSGIDAITAYRTLKKRITSEEGRAALKIVWKELDDDAQDNA